LWLSAYGEGAEGHGGEVDRQQAVGEEVTVAEEEFDRLCSTSGIAICRL